MLDAETEVVPAFLPGRERRITEALVPSITRMAAQFVPPLLARAGTLDFALFGHSMGALVSFELALALSAAKRPPRLLVVSGAPAPHLPRTVSATYHLPEPDFIRHVSAMGGTMTGVFDDPNLRDLLLPILRSDFEACDTYRLEREVRLEVPVLVLGGDSDPQVLAGDLHRWQDIAGASVTVRVFPGDHFFLRDHLGAALGLVDEHLRLADPLPRE
jgi:surfactin synthase thioesterase subunit